MKVRGSLDPCEAESSKLTRDGSNKRVHQHDSFNGVRICYGNVPISDLFLLPGTILGKQVAVLKYDGCNSNVLSSDFMRRNRGVLHIRREDTITKHSDKSRNESSPEVVLNVTVNISDHQYTSNWALASSRYDVFLKWGGTSSIYRC